MSILGKVGNIVRQTASKRIGSEGLRCASFIPNSRFSIGGITCQSDQHALNPKEITGSRVRIDDATHRHGFGARGYSAGAGVSAASLGSNAALANVAGGGLLNLAFLWHVNDGIKDILADYVHHEMTRTVMLLNLRLFLIIAAKDVFVSLAF